MMRIEVNSQSPKRPPGPALERLQQPLKLTGKRLPVALTLEVILRSHDCRAC
jgi:hypothetical protein